MKYLVIFSLFIINTHSINGQSRKGLNLSPSATISYTFSPFGISFLNSTTLFKDYFENKYGLSIAQGIELGYMFHEKNGLFTGLNYCYLNNTFKNGEVHLNHKIQIISIPIYYRLVTNDYGKFGFCLNAGFKLGFIIGASHSIDPTSYVLEKWDRKYVNNPVLNLFVNPGWNIPLGSATNTSLDFGFYLGFQPTTIYKKTNNANENNGQLFFLGVRVATPIVLGKFYNSDNIMDE